MIAKIPVWCLPWTARKRIAGMQALIDSNLRDYTSLVDEVVTEKRAHRDTMQQKIAAEMALAEAQEQLKQKARAITATTAWIFSTHKLDQRASQPGLTDLLKEMPNKG